MSRLFEFFFFFWKLEGGVHCLELRGRFAADVNKGGGGGDGQEGKHVSGE